MSLSISSVVQWDPNQIAATVDREIVILSVERGSYYGLDDIGSEIWEKLASPTSIVAICDALAEKYQGDRATIERDVLALMEQMAAEGLISVES
jgi:predicted transcriptional regulator